MLTGRLCEYSPVTGCSYNKPDAHFACSEPVGSFVYRAVAPDGQCQHPKEVLATQIKCTQELMKSILSSICGLHPISSRAKQKHTLKQSCNILTAKVDVA